MNLLSDPDIPLNISIVTETYPPEINGVALSLQRFVQGLLARGHQIQLVRPHQDQDNATSEDDALDTVIQWGIPLPFYRDLRLGLPAGMALWRLWSQSPPDLVHIVTEGPLGASALRCARRLDIPVTSGFHTNFHRYSQHYGFGFLQSAIVAYLRHFHNRCHCTVVPTDTLRDELQQQGFDNVRVVARGIDTERFDPVRRDKALRQEWSVGEQERVVLHVGRLAAEKNIALAIDAFAAMRQIDPRLRFVLVGDGPLRESLQQQHADLIFCGMRSGEDLARHYASADLFLFPSLTETFGNVLLEAMASGLCALSFDYAAGSQHLRHGVNGLLAPYGDREAFISCAENMAATTPVMCQTLGHQARQDVSRHSWQRVTCDLERLFCEYAREAKATS